jgi:HEPN domain-containing protein
MVDLSRDEDYIAAAEADVRLVQLLLSKIDEFPEAVCYHCEQAVEKMLKQMFVDQGFMPRKNHDLNDLLGVACEREWVRATKEEVCAASFLSFYATKFKYIRMKESEKGEAYEAVISLQRVADMLDRSGYASVTVETPARFLRDEPPSLTQTASRATAAASGAHARRVGASSDSL